MAILHSAARAGDRVRHRLLMPSLSVPIAYADYVSIAILAGMDAVFGGLRAVLEKRFDPVSFVSGFFVNAALAALLAYTGDRLGVNQLYLAAVVALGVRIFYNLGLIRLLLLKRMVPGRSADHSQRAAADPGGVSEE